MLFVLVVRILTVPAPGPPEAKTDAPYYVVRRDDTLSATAQRTGIPVERLMARTVPDERVSRGRVVALVSGLRCCG